MKCIFETYKSIYYNPHREYVSFKINFEKLKRWQRNLKLNGLMRDEKCLC